MRAKVQRFVTALGLVALVLLSRLLPLPEVVVHGQNGYPLITFYNSMPTVNLGACTEIYQVVATGQTANIGTTNFAAAFGAGYYRVDGYTKVTTAGTTLTLPDAIIGWKDGLDGTSPTVAVGTQPTTVATTTAETFTTGTFYVQGGQPITYATTGYASTGTAMQYEARFTLFQC